MENYLPLNTNCAKIMYFFIIHYFANILRNRIVIKYHSTVITLDGALGHIQICRVTHFCE